MGGGGAGQVGMSLVSVGSFAESLPNPHDVTDVSDVSVLGWWDRGVGQRECFGHVGQGSNRPRLLCGDLRCPVVASAVWCLVRAVQGTWKAGERQDMGAGDVCSNVFGDVFLSCRECLPAGGPKYGGEGDRGGGSPTAGRPGAETSGTSVTYQVFQQGK